MIESAAELREVSKNYGGVVALDKLSMCAQKGEFVVLLGPSGSGKTTLLSILGGFVLPTTGTVHIAGRDVTTVPPAQRPTVTVFQDYALFPHMTVLDNVSFGLAMRGIGKKKRNQLADQALSLVDLEGFGDRRIDQLSGGQKQRVALARALVIEPAVLLLDEPLGALDVKIRRQMQEELHRLQRKLGATFIHVTHDQEEAMSLADTIVLLNNGRIEDLGSPERVYSRPSSIFAASFMGETNLLPGKVTWAANDAVKVDTSLGSIVAAGTAQIGSTVHISIRPESIHLGHSETTDAVVLGTGRLHDVVFQGAHRRVHAHLGQDGIAPLLVRLSPDVECSGERVVRLWAHGRDLVLIAEKSQ